MTLLPIIGALLLSATASNAQYTPELDDVHHNARYHCRQIKELCMFIERRRVIIDMCDEVVLGTYDISDLNAYIKRGLLDETWGRAYRLASESAARWCEVKGVKGVVIKLD